MAEKGISSEEEQWLEGYLNFKASELVEKSEKASLAAKDLARALGDQASEQDFEGWIKSAAPKVDEVAAEAVATAEVLADSGPEKVGAELGEESAKEAESDELPDEFYEELGKALADDWNQAVKDGNAAMFEFLATDPQGLWAGVRDQIVKEVGDQQLLGADKAALSEALRDSAWEAMTQAFDGFCEALASAGGYEWLLTREEG